ncbi:MULTISPECIES: hypothetical protein [unclassified Rhizobium]|uniref:hypothetical protein n=1 Tax=unclassified Rhizobium TaxID=2613769 RepID=UPI000700200D|nr:MULTISPECIES: hypothetical protein [unclassified Rhizobium]KQV39176.1 hypothetical protein ASC86_23195 [Rhizobium sp. Root1212]KRD35150.1 hypothetical protein ASE37_21765 [Rhizobium sp. Root268]
MTRWLQAALHQDPTDKTDETDKTSNHLILNDEMERVSNFEVSDKTDKTRQNPLEAARRPNPVHEIWGKLEGDMASYARALGAHGPCGYGAIAKALGWDATRAGSAEEQLRRQGLIAYDDAGRGTLTNGSNPDG